MVEDLSIEKNDLSLRLRLVDGAEEREIEIDISRNRYYYSRESIGISKYY